MRVTALLAMVFSAAACSGQVLSNAFTYQGELRSAGAPSQGAHDLRFRLYDAATGGAQVGATLCSDNLAVADGRFFLQLDFGEQFAGQARYLEIAVRQDTGLACSDSAGFETLLPRQELTVAPNSLFAKSSAAATNSSQLGGQGAAFYTNASNLTAGTLPDARLGATVARTNTAQTFTGALTLSNPANSFTGSGAGLTNLSAGAIATGSLPDARLSANIPRLDALNTFSADNVFSGNLLVNAGTPLSRLHVGGDGYFTGAVRVGDAVAPRAGTIRFNPANHDFQGYTGAWWVSLTGQGAQLPSNIVVFSSPGVQQWTVPSGVVSVSVEVWGGGGGGGGSGSSITQNCVDPEAAGGGAGGSGGFAMSILDVTPGEILTLTIGLGGTGGGVSASGIAGGTSTLVRSAATVLQATGGGAGGPGFNDSLGSAGCASVSPPAVPGTPGSGSLGNFANQSGNMGSPGRRAWNNGGCGFPTSPDIRPGCRGIGGAALSSQSPSAATAGRGGDGGQHSGAVGQAGQNGNPGLIRILY